MPDELNPLENRSDSNHESLVDAGVAQQSHDGGIDDAATGGDDVGRTLERIAQQEAQLGQLLLE